MSRDDEAQVAEAADAVAACVDHAPASAASAPVANVTDATQAGMPAHPSSTAPTSERQPQIASTVTVTTLPAARAHQAKLVGKVTNQSTLVRRARADDEDVARHGAKKPRHDPATATASVVPTKPTSATATIAAAAARPRGKENGAAQYSVAAELEKQLQARLEWSERQKRREEEAKRFRQRQRDEEAVCFAFLFSRPSDLLGLVLTRNLLSSCRPASGKSWRNFVLHSTRLAGNLPPKVPQVRARSGGHRPRFIYLILPHDLLFTETFCSWLMDFLVRERRQSVDGRAWLGEVYSEMIRNKMLPCTIVFAAA